MEELGDSERRVKTSRGEAQQLISQLRSKMFSFEMKTHIWALLHPLFGVIPVHKEELLDIATHGSYLPQKGGREIQIERWCISGAREDQPRPANPSKALGKLNEHRRQ